MHDRPLLFGTDPDRNRFHAAGAGRSPIAGTFVDMFAPQTVGAVVSMFGSECVSADRQPTASAKEVLGDVMATSGSFSFSSCQGVSLHTSEWRKCDLGLRELACHSSHGPHASSAWWVRPSNRLCRCVKRKVGGAVQAPFGLCLTQRRATRWWRCGTSVMLFPSTRNEWRVSRMRPVASSVLPKFPRPDETQHRHHDNQPGIPGVWIQIRIHFDLAPQLRR
jgi:hypothetical protein